jgi:hypothetical protein
MFPFSEVSTFELPDLVAGLAEEGCRVECLKFIESASSLPPPPLTSILQLKSSRPEEVSDLWGRHPSCGLSSRLLNSFSENQVFFLTPSGFA